jgi:hypothetical protein
MKAILFAILLILSCASSSAQEVFKNADLTVTRSNKQTVYFKMPAANEKLRLFILKCQRQMKNCDYLF